MVKFEILDKQFNSTKDVKKKEEILTNIISKARRNINFYNTVDIEKVKNYEIILRTKSTVKNNRLNIAILGYKSNLVGHWDPLSVNNGLPGSEECAVYASEELANRGYNVTLYMNPSPNCLFKSRYSNPRWLTDEDWYSSSNKESYDLVLMWRRFDKDEGSRRGKKVFFWPHDSPGRNGIFPNFDGVLPLTEHHRKQLCILYNFDKVPYAICGNGILPSQFPKLRTVDNLFSIGYFSNYSRGLELLIDIWPDIKMRFPKAILNICYGRETWNTISDCQLKLLIEKIEKYKEIGVIEHGKVGHNELANIMRNTSIWAYPCNTTAETFCITAVKCQAAGCIPVTTRIGALDETVCRDAPSLHIINNNNDKILYTKMLFDTLTRVSILNKEELLEEREKYREFAMKFTWSNCIDKWMELYNKL